MFFHKKGLDYYITSFRLVIKIIEDPKFKDLDSDGVTQQFCNATWPELKRDLENINKHIQDFDLQTHKGALKNVLRAVHVSLSPDSFDNVNIKNDLNILTISKDRLRALHARLIELIGRVDTALSKMKNDKSDNLPVLHEFLQDLTEVYRECNILSPIIKKTIKDLEDFKHLLEQEKVTTDVFENNLKSWLVDVR